MSSFRLLAHAALLASVLLLTACDSNGGSSGDGNTCVDGSLTATAGGSAFASECVSFMLSSGVLSLGALANLDGSDGSTQRQILLVVPNAAEGTTASPIGFIGTYTDGELDGSQFSGFSTTGLSGSLTLTTLTDSRAVGTFSFSGPELEIQATAGSAGTSTPTGRTVSVTGGSFDIRL